MTVELTSPVLGQNVGTTYTGTLEDWLLTQGYAKRAGYTGAGVSNTGTTDVLPAGDPTLPANREAPYFPLSEDHDATIANDVDHLNEEKRPLARFDFDSGSVDTEAPVILGLDPEEGPVAGGDSVRIYGDNLEGVTGVTFDGVAATGLDLNVDAGYLDVTTPAGTAGPATVVVTDNVGADTEVGAYTYVA